MPSKRNDVTLPVTRRNSRTSAIKKLLWSACDSVCHLYVLESVILNTRGYSGRSELKMGCAANTHCDHLQPTEFRELPGLANRECAIIVQLRFVYESTSIICLYKWQINMEMSPLVDDIRESRMYRAFLPSVPASSQILMCETYVSSRLPVALRRENTDAIMLCLTSAI